MYGQEAFGDGLDQLVTAVAVAAEAGDGEQWPEAWAHLEHEGEAPPAAAPSPGPRQLD